MKKSMIIGLAWTAVLAFSPAGADEEEDHDEASPVPVLLEMIEEGQFSGIASQRFEVIRDEESFTLLWLDHTAPISPPPEAPVIDFEQDMVIAVFLGTRPSGGFSIEVVDVDPGDNREEDGNNMEEDIDEEDAAKLVVHVKATLPGPNCVVPLLLTQPYQLVSLPQVPDIVAFQTTVERQDCPASEQDLD